MNPPNSYFALPPWCTLSHAAREEKKVNYSSISAYYKKKRRRNMIISSVSASDVSRVAPAFPWKNHLVPAHSSLYCLPFCASCVPTNMIGKTLEASFRARGTSDKEGGEKKPPTQRVRINTEQEPKSIEPPMIVKEVERCLFLLFFCVGSLVKFLRNACSSKMLAQLAYILGWVRSRMCGIHLLRKRKREKEKEKERERSGRCCTCFLLWAR